MDKKYYIITVVGAPKADDKTKIKYMRDANVPAGFNFAGNTNNKRSFFHLELCEASGTTIVLPNGKTVSMPNPQTKPFTFNCFERSHPELFKAILREIKAHTAEKPTYTKDEGDKSGFRIILENLVVPGAIVPFILPYEVYRMNRDPKTHKLVKFEATRYADDGSIEKVPVTTNTGETFLYGNECDAPEVFIERAKKAVLKVSKQVVAQTHTEDTGSAVVNTSVSEEPVETTEETTETSTDDGDV